MNLELITALVIDSQREKTPLPIAMIDTGKLMLVRPQPEKA